MNLAADELTWDEPRVGIGPILRKFRTLPKFKVLGSNRFSDIETLIEQLNDPEKAADIYWKYQRGVMKHIADFHWYTRQK